MHTDFARDIKKQMTQLDLLVSKLNEKEKLSRSDFYFYDDITRQVEKRLRALRKQLAEELNQGKQSD